MDRTPAPRRRLRLLLVLPLAVLAAACAGSASDGAPPSPDEPPTTTSSSMTEPAATEPRRTPTPAGTPTGDGTDEAAELEAARAAWADAALEDYAYRIEHSCFCPEEHRGPYVVVVRGEDVAVHPETASGIEAPAELVLGPVEALHDLVEDEIAGSDHVEVTYDERGIPVHAEFDRIVEAIDDEGGFTVELLDDADVPTGDPGASGPGAVDAILRVVEQTDDDAVRPDWPYGTLAATSVPIDLEGRRCATLDRDAAVALEEAGTEFAVGAGFVTVLELRDVAAGAGCTQGVTIVPVGDLGGVVLDAAGWGVEEAAWWPMTVDDALAAEDLLAAHAQAQALRRDLDAYVRQYAGVVEDGRDLVAVSAFCAIPSEAWTHERAEVLDGGECYWDALVDVAAGEVDAFTVHGEA